VPTTSASSRPAARHDSKKRATCYYTCHTAWHVSCEHTAYTCHTTSGLSRPACSLHGRNRQRAQHALPLPVYHIGNAPANASTAQRGISG
jgi:hypothetical protein